MTQQREQNGDTGDSSLDVDVSRRDVLVTGAITSGSLLYGSAAASDTVAARRGGGSGFIPIDDFDKAQDADRTFTILGDDGWSLEHPAGCGGSTNRPPEEYTGYEIRFAAGEDDRSDPPTLGHLFVASDRHVTTGSWLDVIAARSCPPAATVTDPSGEETEHRVMKIAFRPTDFGGRAGFRAGEAVLDSEDPDPDPAVVLAVFDVPISDWTVYGTETVAYQNPTYDHEQRVVVVAFERLLDEGWDGWRTTDPTSLFDGVVERGIKFHAFPQTRLERRRPNGP